MNNPSSILEIWKSSQGPLKDRLGATAYETWFASVAPKLKAPNTLILEMPDEFFKNWVLEHHLALVKEILSAQSQALFNIELVVNPKMLEQSTKAKLETFETSFSDQAPRATSLNPRFTFESFVVGPSNRFAHAASLAIVEAPAKAYNPFFIYGGVGLGKTHLMQAVANEISRRNSNLKFSYVTSERFTNELINAIQHHSTPKFRQKYRESDVILIDDIHFIAGKESTQEEFFHTFNALYDSHKQIIISSDRPPREISNLEERLVSRFGWGLTTEIQLPTFETRVAILRKKVEREPLRVPDDVIFYIAQQIKTNIRELEGALIRVVAYSLLEEKEITLETAKEILGDMVKESRRNITVDSIQRHVADYFNLSLYDLKAKKRSKNLVLPRQIAMYLSRELTVFSLPEIGVFFGGKDHTTVLHAWNKIKNGLDKDVILKDTVERLTTGLKK